MKSCWQTLKAEITPGFLKVLGILIIQHGLSFSGLFSGYVTTMNVYNLLEDPAEYYQYTALASILISMPVSLFVEKVFTFKPYHLIPTIYLIKAFLTFVYGCVMYQADWSVVTRLAVCFAVLLIMKIVSSFDGDYFPRHVLPELSKRYGVKLGVMNSASKMLGLTVDSGKMLLVGQLYSRWSVEDASLYLCSGFLFLGISLSFFFYIALGSMEAAPRKQKKGITVWMNIRQQFSTIMESEVKLLVYLSFFSALTISGSYVTLYLLSVGLTEVTVTYTNALTSAMQVITAVINIVKYRWNWEKLFLYMLIVGALVSLVTSLYLSGSWMILMGVPWLKGEPSPDAPDFMPIWMILYFVWYGATGWIHSIGDMMKTEYLQVKIRPEERGAMTGVTMCLGNLIHLVVSVFNFCMPSTEFLYITNFGVSVCVHVAMVVIVWRFKNSQMGMVKEKVLYQQLQTEEN